MDGFLVFLVAVLVVGYLVLEYLHARLAPDPEAEDRPWRGPEGRRS